jgi:hypothetical protein
MNVTIIATLSSFLFLVVLWLAVGIRHLKQAKKGLDNSWEFVDEKIRKRHDTVPVLIECVRMEGVELGEIVERAVAIRDQARRNYFANGDKTSQEYELSKVIDEMVALGVKSEKVSRSTNFLEIKKDLEDLDTDIENRSRDYNETVRKYNETIKFFVLLPFVYLLKLKKALIFEFEK